MGRPWRRTLLGKLITAYLVLTLAVVGAFGFFAHALGRRSLDEELGRRLISIAEATAAQVQPELFAQLEPGDESSRTYAHLERKLGDLKTRTQVARLQLLDRQVRARVDTAHELAIGAPALELLVDRAEIAAALAGKAGASVLFKGQDGTFYKRGYAPLLDDEGRAIGVVAAWGSSDYFAQLERFRRWLLGYGALVTALVIAVSFVVARRITRPLRDLASRATRIGQGELAMPIPQPRSSDEIGVLAATLEEMRQGLALRDERMQRMLAGIAHEVRNPLGGIELFAGLLREEIPEGSPQREHVRRIERELGHLKRVVADFLDFARRPALVLGDIDCQSLLAEVRDLCAKECADSDIRCDLRVEGTVRMRGDEGQLRRALLNLMRNAIQATPTGGSIVLGCQNGDGRVRLSVRDSGAGIAPAERDKIFTAFYTTKERGIGLGLAFVRDIATDHGGRVEVDSEPGHGATFTLELPTWPPS